MTENQITKLEVEVPQGDSAKIISESAASLAREPDSAPKATGSKPPKTAQSSAKRRHDPEAIRHAFETGEFPYATRMSNKLYMEHMEELQVELLKAQNWVKETGQRIVMLFEGRDAAGKGGTIKRFMEHLNPCLLYTSPSPRD